MVGKESKKCSPLDLLALSVLCFLQVEKTWISSFGLKEDSLLFLKGLVIFALFLCGEFKMILYTFRQLSITDVYVNANLISHPNSLLEFHVVRAVEGNFIILSRRRHRFE